jgi:hypothetical protein
MLVEAFFVHSEGLLLGDSRETRQDLGPVRQTLP